jgi:CheY-like chemotaxis protein
MKNPNSILIVDDSLDDIFIAKRAISKCRADCVVEAVSNGHQAIERLVDNKRPSLVLLDLKMPEIGGIEILRFIRAREQIRYMPVVMLTSSKMEEDVKASYDAGANGYLHKTFDLSEFTEKLETTLHYWIDFNLFPTYKYINEKSEQPVPGQICRNE